MFHKRFIYFVTGDKENIQNAHRFDMNFEFCHVVIQFYWLLSFLLNISKKNFTYPFKFVS